MVASSPPPGAFRFRTLGLAELLDETFRIYRRDLGLFAGLSLAVTLPGVIMGLLAGSYRSVGWMTRFFQSLGNPDAMQAMAQTPPPQGDPALSLLATIVRLIMFPLTLGVIVYAANQVMNGRTTTILRALEGTLQRYWALAGLSLLIGLVVFSGIVVLTIPVVIWLLVRWGVSVPALLAEGLSPVDALGRSWGLVDGRWWRTVGIFCLVLLLTGVASAMVEFMAGFIIGLIPALGEDFRSGLAVVAASLAGALVAPVTYIAITLMYYDLRVRREGFDLDQLAQQAQPPSAA
jgi:hypothetical protein